MDDNLKTEVQIVQSQRLKSIGTLACGVAHELSNPLMIVINLAQLIMEDAGSTATSREHASTITDECKRMTAMVHNLLSFSRFDTEPCRPADVRTLVDRTLSLMGSTFRKDRIKVFTRIPERLPKVRCLSQQIQQVLMNA